MESLLGAWKDGVIVRESILPALAAIASGVPFDRGRLPGLCTPAELETVIQRMREQLERTPMANPEKTGRVLLGLVMEQVRGRIDGRTVAETLARQPGRSRT
jgi:Glu-tRNA(Gln) amidotransferase subunit E-like FAD-binding protein